MKIGLCLATSCSFLMAASLSFADVQTKPDVKEHQTFETQKKVEHYNTGAKASELSYKNLEEEPLVKHGSATFYTPNGEIKGQGTYINNKEQGFWTIHSKTGERSEGHFEDGLKTGKWSTYASSDELLADESYTNGKLQGSRTTYFLDGTKMGEEYYQAGQLQGPKVSWYANGEKGSETFWLQGIQNGPIRAWNDNGVELLSGTYQAGVPSGKWMWNDHSGEEVQSTVFENEKGTFYMYQWPEDKELSPTLAIKTPYEQGEIHGEQTAYYPNGKLATSIQFHQGKKQGEAKEYYEDSSLKTTLSFENSRPSGERVDYYPKKSGEENSQIAKKMHFENDGLEAQVEEFYSKGEKKTSFSQRAELKEGPFTAYYQNGNVQLTGQFTGDKKQGEWTEYFSSGSLMKKTSYQMGRLDGQYEEWYEAKDSEEVGVQKVKGMFSNDLKVDRWDEWYSDSSKHFEIEYESGVPHGMFRKFFAATLLKEAVETNEGEDEKPLNDFANITHLEGNFVLGEKEGTWVSKHTNGLLESRIQYTNGLRDGVYEEWFAHTIEGSARPKIKGAYRNDVQEGPWIAYFHAGGSEVVQNYRNGQLDGRIDEYYPNGATKSETHFALGKQEGPFTMYHPNKKEMIEAYYHNDLLDGEYVVFHENGKVALEGFYYRGLPANSWSWYSESGKKPLASESFNNGSGLMHSFYPSGEKKSSTEYHLGLKHGQDSSWFSSGQVQNEQTFQHGLLNGSNKTYSETGKLLSDSNWEMGQKHGTSTFWYGNEQERFSLTYHYDIPQGDSTEWHENGQLKTEGAWSSGSRTGTWKAFNRYGEPLVEEIYDQGVLTSFTAFESMDESSSEENVALNEEE